MTTQNSSAGEHPRKKEIPAAFDKLHTHIGLIEGQVDTLASRLAPVLTVASPREQPPVTPKSASVDAVDLLSCKLNLVVERCAEIVATLADLEHRLQL